MNTTARTWYLTSVAAIYLVLCSTFCVYNASLYVRPNSATVPLAVQLICLGMAVSAGVYFLNARLGHKALLVLTIVTLIHIGTSDPKATMLHLIVLSVLLLPFIRRQRHDANTANKSVPPL